MRLLLAVLTALALAGCATQPPAVEAPAALPAPAAGPTPVSLSFPAVGVEGAPLSPTGLDGQGAVEVPPITDPGRVVWLRWSERLAPNRPLLVAAHVSGRDAEHRPVPGAFSRLGEAIPGDQLTVRDGAGELTTYTVRSVRSYPKTAFPTEVYEPRPVRTAVLVTCSGTLSDGNFSDNTVVTAEATS